jgi:RimJ/RimL family protein N-acetyltransferase
MDIVPVRLAGSTVVLEPLQTQDLESVYDAALADTSIWRWSPDRMQSRADAAARFLPTMTFTERKLGISFVTRDAATNAVVGGTCFCNASPKDKRVEIGYTWLVREYQRTRANTEAKFLMMQHAFDVWGALRVEWKTDVRNTTSRNAIARLGAKEEGILRSHTLCWDGHRRDSIYFSVLDTEWPEAKARLLGFLKNR